MAAAQYYGANGLFILPRVSDNSCVLDISSKKKNLLWAISNWFQWIISLFYLPGFLIYFFFLFSTTVMLPLFRDSLYSASAHGEKTEQHAALLFVHLPSHLS